MRRAKRLQEKAPDLYEKVGAREGEKIYATTAAEADLRRRDKQRKRSEPGPPSALGTFPVLLADLPWRYDHSEPSRAVENQYPTMTLEEIKALEVPADPDAVLFLWATSPKLPQALEVMAAWGFEYRTCAVWVKDRVGMGHYFRQQHELLLVGRRGKLPVPLEQDRPTECGGCGERLPETEDAQESLLDELSGRPRPVRRPEWA